MQWRVESSSNPILQSPPWNSGDGGLVLSDIPWDWVHASKVPSLTRSKLEIYSSTSAGTSGRVSCTNAKLAARLASNTVVLPYRLWISYEDNWMISWTIHQDFYQSSHSYHRYKNNCWQLQSPLCISIVQLECSVPAREVTWNLAL